jgi:hypothetical protein
MSTHDDVPGAEGRPPEPAPGHGPPGPAQYYLPVATPAPAEGARLTYEPRVFGVAEVVLTDRRRRRQRTRTYRLMAPAPEPGRPVDWSGAEEVAADLGTEVPGADAAWADVPPTARDPQALQALEQSLAKYAYDRGGQTLLHNRHLDLWGEPGEGWGEFLARCREAAGRASEPEVIKAMHASRTGLAAERVQQSWRKKAEDVKEVTLAPRKADVRVTHFGLAWAPVWRTGGNGEAHAIPAYARAGAAGAGRPDEVRVSADDVAARSASGA